MKTSYESYVMLFTVFEQFQVSWGTYALDELFFWIESLVVYFLVEMCGLGIAGEHLDWLRVLYCYVLDSMVSENTESSPDFTGSTLGYNIDMVLECADVVDIGVLTELTWMFSYIASNWLSALMSVLCIVWLMLFLMPLNGVGRHSVLVSLLIRMFSTLYSFFYDLVYSYLKHDTRNFFPFIFYIFLFITAFNLCGMLPYSLALTSHLVVTFSIAFVSWGGLILCGLDYHGMRLFSIFYPKGLSFYLVPFICVIEVVSHLFRFVSLALRLFSNIVAGHILVDIVCIFTLKLLSMLPNITNITNIDNLFSFSSLAFITFGTFLAYLCFMTILVLFLFECAICILQGYIFAVLCTIYCRDYVQLTH